jgi:predicted tellurium resistance membrane protein TerC
VPSAEKIDLIDGKVVGCSSRTRFKYRGRQRTWKSACTQAFWVGLAKIIGVNIVLSGDNAVVIAFAAAFAAAESSRSWRFCGAPGGGHPADHPDVFAVALLALPWLKIVGGLLLFWIGIKLLVPEEPGDDVAASDS